MFIYFFYFVHCTPCYRSIWNWTGSIMNWKPMKSGEYIRGIFTGYSVFFLFFFNLIFMVLFLWFLWVWYHEKFINKAMKTPLQHEITVKKPRLMLIFKVFFFFLWWWWWKSYELNSTRFFLHPFFPSALNYPDYFCHTISVF